MSIRVVLFGFACLIVGAVAAGAANNIAIMQPNGQVAILATTEVAGVHTITIKCQ